MRHTVMLAVLVGGLTANSLAAAGAAPIPVGDDGKSTTAFVGLNWSFGATPHPEVVLGVAHGNSDSSGDLTGAKAALFFDLRHGFVPSKVKLTGLYGKTYVQGEAGLGYNFDTGTGFGVGGFNGSYYTLGADFDLYGGIEGYLGAHSIGKFDKKESQLPPT